MAGEELDRCEMTGCSDDASVGGKVRVAIVANGDAGLHDLESDLVALFVDERDVRRLLREVHLEGVKLRHRDVADTDPPPLLPSKTIAEVARASLRQLEYCLVFPGRPDPIQIGGRLFHLGVATELGSLREGVSRSELSLPADRQEEQRCKSETALEPSVITSKPLFRQLVVRGYSSLFGLH